MDLIVEDYFAMLVKDLLGQPYSKAEHNRALQALIGRSKGSIEFKHQNLSAAMKLMGQLAITGYLPAWNFQQALFDTVGRWLDRHPDWLPFPRWRTSSAVGEQGRAVGTGALLPDPPQLWFGPPRRSKTSRPQLAAETISRIGETYVVAGRDARNKALGDAGEELVLHHERTSLTDAGRDDLARQVRWTARKDGDGFGYDIRSFEPDGRDRLLEVKTTNGWNRTPFWITRNECAVADRHRDHWHLVRLWNFARRPEAFTLRPPLDAHLALTPKNFLAQFR